MGSHWAIDSRPARGGGRAETSPLLQARVTATCYACSCANADTIALRHCFLSVFVIACITARKQHFFLKNWPTCQQSWGPRAPEHKHHSAGKQAGELYRQASRGLGHAHKAS